MVAREIANIFMVFSFISGFLNYNWNNDAIKTSSIINGYTFKPDVSDIYWLGCINFEFLARNHTRCVTHSWNREILEVKLKANYPIGSNITFYHLPDQQDIHFELKDISLISVGILILCLDVLLLDIKLLFLEIIRSIKNCFKFKNGYQVKTR